MKVYRNTDEKHVLTDLIEKAESQGYLTTEDIMEAFTEEDSPEQIEEMFVALQSAGVEIYDERGDAPETAAEEEKLARQKAREEQKMKQMMDELTFGKNLGSNEKTELVKIELANRR